MYRSADNLFTLIREPKPCRLAFTWLKPCQVILKSSLIDLSKCSSVNPKQSFSYSGFLDKLYQRALLFLIRIFFYLAHHVFAFMLLPAEFALAAL
jgi:hypothetical protein